MIAAWFGELKRDVARSTPTSPGVQSYYLRTDSTTSLLYRNTDTAATLASYAKPQKTGAANTSRKQKRKETRRKEKTAWMTAQSNTECLMRRRKPATLPEIYGAD